MGLVSIIPKLVLDQIFENTYKTAKLAELRNNTKINIRFNKNLEIPDF